MSNQATGEICREMNEVRANIDDDVEEIVESARTLSDWHYYVRKYPWLCLGGAAAVGFLLVPKRVEVISPSAEVLEKLARRNKLVVESNTKAQAKSGLSGMVLTLLANAAMRSAIAFVGQNAGKWLGSEATPGGENGAAKKPHD